MEGGLLSLKWNNHRTTFFHVLSNIRKKEAYTDTTLACDGKFYPVHKLVLSTCSEYFEQIFERAECKHPVIILKDIVSDDLEALLNYMYLGEVNVLQEKLSSLIKAAECLKIRGLAVPDEDPAHSNSGREKRSSTGDFGSESKRRKQDSDSSNQKSRDSTSKDRPKEESNVTTSRSSPSDSRDFPDRQSDPGGGSSSKSAKKPNRTSDDFVEERVPPTEYESDIKKEPQEVYDLEEEEDTKENLLQVEASLGYLANNEQGADEGPLDRLMGNDMASGDDNDSSNLPGISGLQMKNWNSNENLSSGSYDNFATQDDTGQMASMGIQDKLWLNTPNLVDYSSMALSSIGQKTPNLLPPIASTAWSLNSQHKCPLCDKFFPDKYHLTRHERTHTKEKPFQCPRCPYRSARKDNLKTHVLNRHTFADANLI